MSVPRRLLFVSNGAGEDSIAAQIITELPKSLPIEALPLVGEGSAYKGIAPISGPIRNMPSGGLIQEDWRNFWKDLGNGLACLTLKQLFWLRSNRSYFNQIVAVGDLWPVILAALSGIRPITFIGTAKSDYHHPYSALEAWVLRTFKVRSIVRDEPTAESLRKKGVKAIWVGNAMMDGLVPQELNFSLDDSQEVGLALFPGSRQATYRVLPRLLNISQMLSQRLGKKICAFIAVAPSIDTEKLAKSCPGFITEETPYPGWSKLTSVSSGATPLTRFFLVKGHLADVLKYSQVALGLAGTAHEQAAGHGIPIVAYEPGGETRLKWYRARQKGLLGEALIVCEDYDPEIIETLCQLIQNKADRERRGAIGRERLGPPGGAARMAQILTEISAKHP
ncbi:MAG: lipid-A-disaccharide synthase-related protein [Candidatus Bruticola sp.]